MTDETTDPACDAHRGPFRESISKAEINTLELHRYDGDIELVQDDQAVAHALRALKQETVLGFDTETRPSFRKGQSYQPSLVQLCGEKKVYIFQLPKLQSMRRLFRLLANPDVRKVGVAVDFDTRQLQELSPFEPSGFLNLESLADEFDIKNNGLRGLTAIVLGFRISKSEQRSNWAREPLTERQITYAATDAWVSREIYLRLFEELERRKNGDKIA